MDVSYHAIKFKWSPRYLIVVVSAHNKPALDSVAAVIHFEKVANRVAFYPLFLHRCNICDGLPS